MMIELQFFIVIKEEFLSQYLKYEGLHIIKGLRKQTQSNRLFTQ